MASSGSVDFDLTRNEIINDALIHCGATEAGESPAAADTSFAARQLNRMVKSWQADGLHLWTIRETYLFTVLSQARYRLGGATGEHFAAVDDTIRTEIATAVTAGASSLVVDSTTGMLASDAVGVVLDDKTIEWDTISSVTNSTTLALTGTISAAAAVDNTVFTYTTKLGRPLRVLDIERTNADDLDTPIKMISHREYQRLPNKTTVGKTNEAYYQPEIPDGFIYLWPEPETAADRMRLTCAFPIEDFDTSSNNPDLPQEWLDALTWGLARRLLPSYGRTGEVAALILREAQDSYDIVLGWDREPESTYFTPELSWGE